MKNIIDDYLIQAKVGRRQSYGNLTIFPLLSAYALNLDYILLNEAISENLIEVMEVDEE